MPSVREVVHIHIPFDVGIPVVVGVVLAIGLFVALVDLWLDIRNQPPVGYYVQSWSAHSPWLAAGLLAVLAALLGHFFLHDIVFY
jgi:hypothetical protein